MTGHCLSVALREYGVQVDCPTIYKMTECRAQDYGKDKVCLHRNIRKRSDTGWNISFTNVISHED